MPSALLNLSLSERHAKRRENRGPGVIDKISAPISLLFQYKNKQPNHQTFFEGLPKNPKNFARKLYVVGVPDCGLKHDENMCNSSFLQNPNLNVRVKIRNFHHFCGSAKASPCSGRFSALFRKTSDTPVGQYGDPWSEVPQGNKKGTIITRFSKCIKTQKVALTA